MRVRKYWNGLNITLSAYNGNSLSTKAVITPLCKKSNVLYQHIRLCQPLWRAGKRSEVFQMRARESVKAGSLQAHGMR
jgi:hypothetical protein